VPEEIVQLINNQISELRTFLDSKPQTQENLIEFQGKQDKLSKLLTYASLMAGFKVVVHKILICLYISKINKVLKFCFFHLSKKIYLKHYCY